MDHMISATEAGERLAEMLREVASGESYTVLSEGKPVARLVPPPVQQKSAEERASGFLELLKRLEKEPRRIIGPWKREDLYD